MNNNSEEKQIALLPLRGLLIFPRMSIHLDVGREKSLRAVDNSITEHGSLIFLSGQKEFNIEDPEQDDIYRVGTVAKIKQTLNLPNGRIRIMIEGLYRARIVEYLDNDEHFEVRYEPLIEKGVESIETVALGRTVLRMFNNYLTNANVPVPEAATTMLGAEEPDEISDLVASFLQLKLVERQELLEMLSVHERLEKLFIHLNEESEIQEIERLIQDRVKGQMDKTQKEYYLREQIKAIHKEIGEQDAMFSDAIQMRERLEKFEAPEEVKEKMAKEINRLERTPSNAAESSVIYNYLDWLFNLPWTNETKDLIDIKNVKKILDSEHYGLEKAKERVLEYLSVQKLVGSLKGPILCLVGPPGVGKTSLAKSVATAINRKLVRISLGGVRDESEIRGHRRTYIGSMPGRIIQGMRSAGSINPVFVLDEIDKLNSDFRGDPASALLEVLDPEQNNTFSDHYIELPYDLSKVMFITTANSTHSIPRPLLDRMEIINISGYTELEKLQIAKNFLLPKNIKSHGLNKTKLKVQDSALQRIISEYTREAGVRNLEREIAKICRKAAKVIVAGEQKSVNVSAKNLERFLGKPRYRYGLIEKENHLGAATGLAWTAVGGDTLSVEASIFPGKGKLILTGQLGDVMKESATAAFSYIRGRAGDLNIDPGFSEKNDIHIHVPEGAIPKDGPSAGITMAIALISALTGTPVLRTVGMTGEITLRGRVLAIGGLKEKVLAAHRAGLTTVILPKDNEKDLEDIPEEVKQDMNFVLVETLDEVIAKAMVIQDESK